MSFTNTPGWQTVISTNVSNAQSQMFDLTGKKTSTAFESTTGNGRKLIQGLSFPLNYIDDGEQRIHAERKHIVLLLVRSSLAPLYECHVSRANDLIRTLTTMTTINR